MLHSGGGSGMTDETLSVDEALAQLMKAINDAPADDVQFAANDLESQTDELWNQCGLWLADGGWAVYIQARIAEWLGALSVARGGKAPSEIGTLRKQWSEG